jgi:chromosome segregation ATPase
MNKRMARVDSELVAVRSSITELSSRVATLERTMIGLQTDIRDMRGGVTNLLVALAKRHDELDLRWTAMEKRQADTEQRQTAMEKRQTDMEQRLTSIEKRQMSMDAKLDAILARLPVA